MDKNDSIVDIYIFYYGAFIWLIFSITILLSGSLTVKGAILEGWLLYGFISVTNILFLYHFKSIMQYLVDKNEGKITRKIIICEFIKSPFFIIFFMVLFYQNFSFSYFNKYILFILYIPFFYFQYIYLKKMESYSIKL